MFSTTTTSVSTTFNDSLDTKYTVAELLSSLANGGGPITPTSQYPTSMPNYVSEVSTTPTSTLLTPSTLTSIEQTFIELQNVPSTTATSHIPSHVTESGFVPPVVSSQTYNSPPPNMVIKQEYSADIYSDESSTDPDWMPDPNSPKRMRNNAGNAVQVSSTTGRRTGPRGRRSDESLTPDELEKRRLRRERNKLAAAKCRQRRVDLTNTLQTQTEGLEQEKHSLESEIQQLQAQKEQLEFLLQAHTPLCNAKDKVRETEVKASRASTALSRPNSLAIPSSTVTTTVSVTEATGIPITTPSTVLGALGLDSMMDGHTGLTPITGAPSCASEVQRNSTSDSSPTDMSSPTTLMAL